MAGEDRQGATSWRPFPEDQRREGRQRSEEEHSNLPSQCARRARPGEKKLGRTFRGRESQSGRKCERPGEEGGRGRASGRGRSRRRRPRLPHPQVRLRGSRAGAGGCRARAGGGEECGPAGARGGARGGRGGEVGAEPGAPAPQPRASVLGDVTALESEECRAAGAPSAGPGEVAHFECGGFGEGFQR